MNRAQTGDDFVAAKTDDFSPWKQLLQNSYRLGILRIIENGNEHDVIGDVEICVTRRQARAVTEDRSGARQSHDG